MGGSAWIVDAFAEHYCTRKFPWYPDNIFWDSFNWLKKRFPNARRIDSTVLGFYGEVFNPGDNPWQKKEEETECLQQVDEKQELCMGLIP